MNRVEIMDIPFINERKETLLNQVYQAVENNDKQFIVTANPEIVMKTRADRAYKQIVQSADYVVPDGIGILLAAKRYKTPLKERIPGVELMESMLSYANKHRKTCYFLGAEDKVNQALIKKIKMHYPDLIIGGYHHGFFELDDEAIVEDVKRSNADFVFVALGFPRQENWINQHFASFEKGVFMGVGGSFDVLSDTVKRAPAIWIKLNLEWLYRIVKQPTRAFRVLDVVKFIILTILKK